jgi:hypothetical protein
VQISVNRSDILSIDRSPDSPMPVGLINSLNAQEVADLLAYPSPVRIRRTRCMRSER